MSGVVRGRLAAAGIELPEVSPPSQRYVPLRRCGQLAFCAGVTSDGINGTAGLDATMQDGQAAAAIAARRALHYIENELGSLDAVADIMRMKLAIYVRLTHAPCNQLRVLRAEIENEDFLVGHSRRQRSTVRRECHERDTRR